MSARISTEYNGKPTLELRELSSDERPLISFQMRKAKVIYEHIEQLKAFVESDGQRLE